MLNFKLIQNLIDTMKLPFRSERWLYLSFYRILGFYPHHLEYYRQALTHSSMQQKASTGRPLNNERLEYLGDAILDAVVGDIVYRTFQGRREGFLTNARSRLVKRETLGRVAKDMGLTELIRSNSGSQSHNSYMGGNAFEALVGAVYLDRGYDLCMWFFEKRVLGKYLDFKQTACTDRNYKSQLLEWSQKNRVELQYNIIEEGYEGKMRSPYFLTQVSVGGEVCGEGRGYSKKESQQLASAQALKYLRKKAQK